MFNNIKTFYCKPKRLSICICTVIIIIIIIIIKIAIISIIAITGIIIKFQN